MIKDIQIRKAFAYKNVSCIINSIKHFFYTKNLKNIRIMDTRNPLFEVFCVAQKHQTEMWEKWLIYMNA